MLHPIPTVKIDRPDLPGGHLVIDEDSYDPETMTIWGEETETKATDDDQVVSVVTPDGPGIVVGAGGGWIKVLLDGEDEPQNFRKKVLEYL